MKHLAHSKQSEDWEQIRASIGLLRNNQPIQALGLLLLVLVNQQNELMLMRALFLYELRKMACQPLKPLLSLKLDPKSTVGL